MFFFPPPFFFPLRRHQLSSPPPLSHLSLPSWLKERFFYFVFILINGFLNTSGETVDVQLQEAVKGKIIFFHLPGKNFMFITSACLKNDCERGRQGFESSAFLQGNDLGTIFQNQGK
jgi:hypothetical protein